jgi:hypothetical protein
MALTSAFAPSTTKRSDRNIEREAEELQKLKLGVLRTKYTELVGTETKSNNRPYLIRRILRAPATVTSPGRNEDSVTNEPPSGPTKPAPRERDPRIPSVGTVLEREYDGKTLKVKVLEDGFQFRGKTYRSLSAIAKDATGTTWNGLLFFGLVKRTKGTA